MHLSLRHPFIRMHVFQGMRFAVCGGAGAIVDFSSLYILVQILGVVPYVGYVGSTSFALIVVFFSNKYFTFKNHEKKHGTQFLKFLLVYGTSFVLNVGIASFLYWFGLQYMLAKALAIAILAFWNYSLSHGFVFKRQENLDVGAI
ncbi:hypothetical protein A3D11_03620 [Candidatus Peribacteria bacterium RIFCSPHIGHO2_02_FULL_49_16]|nr:MAG: hypothetical protein A2880_04580 [Candidatus Peribacteria bacterium RIFCSPHIGHO2_01_FULL_49_38]OGJ58822.1 MAG: hypothetical protein A3D11_03620 [Candidatus Peribacteria bacterium RIFCSPHIGHO2_02_FULL_49_16]